GITQVFYVAMLAGENDLEKINETGDGREINRHNYTVEEIEQALEKDVVKRLMKLTSFRNSYDAFNGEFSVVDTSNEEICLVWKKDTLSCTLFIDLKTKKTTIEN